MSKPQNKVKIDWTPDFAYAIGLIVTDGSLSKDGRHIFFTSKETQMIDGFKSALNIEVKTKKATSGYNPSGKYYRVQFGDINFYRFLKEIGLMPNKSKIIGEVKIPDEFFFDFLRGHFDGDGTFYSYFDKRWRSSFMYYMTFLSASPKHIAWLQKMIERLIGIKGHITKFNACLQLKYAKRESDILIKKLYPNPGISCLNRKLLKIVDALSIMRSQYARVAKQVTAAA